MTASEIFCFFIEKPSFVWNAAHSARCIVAILQQVCEVVNFFNKVKRKIFFTLRREGGIVVKL